MAIIFGLDFGTTNSLVSLIDGGRILSLINEETEAPHPSMVIARGQEIVCGQLAKEQANDEYSNAGGDVVRSPKIHLGQDDNTYPIPGRKDLHRIDLVSEVLSFLKQDAASRSGNFAVEKAVFTVPVSFDGKSRQELREAAAKAGIEVAYFVHEPLAALYGYFREQSDAGQRIEDFDGSHVLVFDWGGGTLDLTLCQIRGGVLHQIRNAGNSELGGDTFDDNITKHVMTVHASKHKITGLQAHLNPDVSVKLKLMCEDAKKKLSEDDEALVYINRFLTRDDPTSTLDVTLTRAELEDLSEKRIARGIEMIQQLLDGAGIDYSEVAFCLPTGGMVNMPAIRRQLDQLFPGRVVKARNGDRIISEGAAWIANDRAVPVLSKPLEFLDASNSPNIIAEANEPLPVNGHTKEIVNSQFYCTDPRHGAVVFRFQRPMHVGRYDLDTERTPYGMINLKVDDTARPLLERLNLNVKIDENYIVKVTASSSMRCDEQELEISNLEFALRAQELVRDGTDDLPGDEAMENHKYTHNEGRYPQVRSTLSAEAGRKGGELIAGDIIDNFWEPFDIGRPRLTKVQNEERDYYKPCSTCGRSIIDINNAGCDKPGCIVTAGQNK